MDKEEEKKTNKMPISEKKQYIVDLKDVADNKWDFARIKAKRRVVTYTLCNEDEITETKVGDTKYLYEVMVKLSVIDI